MTRFVKGLLLVLAVALVALPAAAQIDTGSIVGIVTDASGAVVPNVLVTATNEGTNLSVSSKTNELGQYVLSGLKIGTYRVTAELASFRKTVQSGIELHVQDRLAVNLVLQVGEVAQAVEVTSAAPLLDSQSADMGAVVEQRRLLDLSLNGRRYEDLALLAPGVLPRPGTGNPSEGRFNVNGNFSLHNNFVLDGVDNNVASGLMGGTPQIVQPAPDALQEFRVQTRTYSTEFGAAQGAVINATIRSGSNALHGSVYHFLRNSALDSNDFFANRNGIKKGNFVFNQGGFTVGGPVNIPKVYDGRNKTFFFFDWAFLRIREALTATSTVPTAAMKNGDFSGIPGVTLIDPGSVIPSEAGCIVNNRIQATSSTGRPCIDPVGQAYAKLLPDPLLSGPFTGSNYTANVSNKPGDKASYDIRVDQKVTDHDTFFARYSFFKRTDIHERGAFPTPLVPGNFSATLNAPSRQAVASWTHLFASSMVNEARFGFGRSNAQVAPLAPAGSAADTIGLKNVPKGPLNYGLPEAFPFGFDRIGTAEWRPQFQVSQVWQALDNLSWVKGTHQFKFGFDWKRYTSIQLDLRAPQGAMYFSDSRYVNGSPDSSKVAGLVNLLLGNVTTFNLTSAQVFHDYLDGWSGYAQDTWRINPKFTLNYGLRYEFFTPWIDRNNQTANFDFANGGRIITATDGGIFERALIHPDRNNFAPRVGFAYNPWKRWTFRGGVGIFHQAYDRIGSESIMQLNPPFLVDRSIGVSTTQPPVFFLRDGYPTLPTPSVTDPAFLQTVQVRAQNQNSRTPYVEQMSLSTEYELAHNLVFEISGVANYAHKVRKLRQLNQGRIVGPQTVVFPYQANFRTGFIQYLDTDGNTNFHALEMRLEKRYSSGLSLLASYTYSKVLGNVSDNLSAGFSGGTQTYPQNVYNLRADYGPLPFDQRQRLAVSYVYELPIGRGSQVLNSGVVGRILEKWQISGSTVFNSGAPLTFNGSNNSNTVPSGNAATRANCVGDPHLSGRTIDNWFNKAAFTNTTPFTFGTCGVGTLTGPGLNNWNFSLFKKIPITEGRSVEFRSEFFNLWNHPQFYAPNTSVTSGSFGKISALRVPARQIQFGLKFYF